MSAHDRTPGRMVHLDCDSCDMPVAPGSPMVEWDVGGPGPPAFCVSCVQKASKALIAASVRYIAAKLAGGGFAAKRRQEPEPAAEGPQRLYSRNAIDQALEQDEANEQAWRPMCRSIGPRGPCINRAADDGGFCVYCAR